MISSVKLKGTVTKVAVSFVITTKQREMKMSDKVLVATYGSLRRNMQNFRVNERAGGKFFGHGKTVENFDLFRFGGAYFPSVSLKHSDSGKPVVVDVFETDMAGLTGPYDMLEGYDPVNPEDGFYNRTQIEIELDSGEVVKAWIYHICEEQNERVESGDWCLYNDPEYYEKLNKQEAV